MVKVLLVIKQLSDEESFNNLPFQLGLLRNAINYQKWILERVTPFLGENILEVGSGIGNMSRWLPVRESLILSEVDSLLFPYLQDTVNKYFGDDKRVKVLKIDLDKDWKKLFEYENIDTIVSFNVMEHVEKDELFFADLISILKKSRSSKTKKLITFVPAHRFLYGSADKNYGHYKRYACSDFKKMKDKVIPQANLFCRYFNVIGLPGWFFLGKIFKSKEISEKSVLYFEKLCPWVKPFDDFFHLRLRVPFGQSLLCIVTF